MSYAVSGTDVRGVNTVKRKTPELALRKARELIKRGCYDVQIKTPEGRTYHSTEFAELPRTPAGRPAAKPARRAAAASS